MPAQREFRIIDLPDHARPYGFQIVINCLRRQGHNVTELSSGGLQGATGLLSLYWCEDRLRRIVHKPIKADWLVQRIHEYSEQGVTRCLAYNIFGLPGEAHEDFQEWDDTVRRIVAAVKPPFTWVNSWNAFLPMPMTPLAGASSSWGSDHRNLHRIAETRTWAKGKGVQVFDMPERCSNATITARMLAVRATAASAHIVSTLAMNPHMPERQVLKEFEAVEGYHLHGAIPATLAVAKEENLNGRP